MGRWGMGLTQSDEFCEYYEEFIERYKNGEAPKDIAASMLEEYAGLVADFGEGILHDVYFAIAKGQWMCGALEPYIIKKVTAIIDSGDNIEWYRSLDADERDLKKRQAVLEKFLSGLQTPREKPMKQPGLKKERALPDVQTGDCFAYHMEDGWHHLVVLERCKSDFLYVAVMAGSTPERLSAADLADKPVYTAKLYSAETMLGKSKLKKIGCVDIAPGLYAGQFPKPWLLKGCKADFAGQNGFALHYVVIAGLSYRVIYDLKQQYPAMTLERLLSQRHGQPGTLTGPLANFGEKGNVLDDCISCLTEEQFLFFCFSSMGMGNIMDPQQYEDCIGIPMNDLHE